MEEYSSKGHTSIRGHAEDGGADAAVEAPDTLVARNGAHALPRARVVLRLHCKGGEWIMTQANACKTHTYTYIHTYIHTHTHTHTHTYTLSLSLSHTLFLFYINNTHLGQRDGRTGCRGML